MILRVFMYAVVVAVQGICATSRIQASQDATDQRGHMLHEISRAVGGRKFLTFPFWEPQSGWRTACADRSNG